jgi:hypothetical protein
MPDNGREQPFKHPEVANLPAQGSVYAGRAFLHSQKKGKGDSGMSRFRNSLIVALGVAALVIPAAAVANGQGKANGKGKTHAVAYVFRGLYAGEGSVEVKAGNSRVRKGGLVNTTVTFDLTNARIVVADTNGDGQRTLEDVATGDKVVVKAMLPRKEPGSQPFVAKRLVDQTQPPEPTS